MVWTLWKGFRSDISFDRFRAAVQTPAGSAANLSDDAGDELAKILAEFDQLFRPRLVYRRAVEILQRFVDPSARRRVRISLSEAPKANAWSQRRRIAALGYLVGIHNHLYSLIFDVSELYVATQRVVSKNDDLILVDADWKAQDLGPLLGGLLYDYIHNSGAWHGSLELRLNGVNRRIRELYVPCGLRRHPVGLYALFMAYFVIGHELGHIALGHCDRPLPEDQSERWEEEFGADAFAGTLLLSKIKEDSAQPEGGKNREAAALTVSAAMTAVAILFGLLELADRTAQRFNKPWAKNHPPAIDRYHSFRALLVQGWQLPEALLARADLAAGWISLLWSAIPWEQTIASRREERAIGSE
jgi:hypothetical protein